SPDGIESFAIGESPRSEIVEPDEGLSGSQFLVILQQIQERRHFLASGPTVRVISVRRFATSLLPAGPPTPVLASGPTVRVISVRRFATSLLPAGPPTPVLASGPTVRVISVRRFAT